MPNLDSVNHCTSDSLTGSMANLDSVNHCTSKEITGTMVEDSCNAMKKIFVMAMSIFYYTLSPKS